MGTLYLDPFAGIAGDMLLGALIDLGVDCEKLDRGLSTLGIPGLKIKAERRVKGGISGVDVHVVCEPVNEEHAFHEHLHDHHHDHHHSHDHVHVHRGLSDILAIIDASSLPDRVKERSSKAFDMLAQAEGAVHGVPKEQVHFHEVGAWDSIADLVGCFLAVELLDVDRVVSGPVNLGSGTVECAHGRLPVPAPATAKLLAGLPVYAAGTPGERTTPTGALLIRVLADSFGPIPRGVISATGIGHGDRDTGDANFLRVLLVNEEMAGHNDYETGHVAIMETNIDDMNPQDWSPLMERLFEAGALDVFLTQIMMKKGRPGVRLTCVARPRDREFLGKIILEHSTTLGLRWQLANRMTLRRQTESFESSLGSVDVKKALWGQKEIHLSLEFEDLKKLAVQHNLPLSEVRRRVTAEHEKVRRSDE